MAKITTGQKQRQFTRMIGLLIEFAYANGYELSFGHALRCPDCKVGSKHSLHRSRLAVDFNLFKNGKYLEDTESYRPLGEYWESLGGSWGGRFSSPDGCHFSLEHLGYR